MTHLVDALCHLELMAPVERTTFLARARSAGVSDVVSAVTDPALDSRVLQGATGSIEADPPEIWYALGIHPSNAPPTDEELDEQMLAIEQHLGHAKVVALGECGLDRRPGFPSVSRQREALSAQLRLARRHQLPTIIHCVRSFGLLLDVLDENKSEDLTGFVHGYTGSPELVIELVRRGLAISFGHRLCAPKAARARAAAQIVPMEFLLLETDGPESSPDALPRLTSIVADLKGVTIDEVTRVTSSNARRILHLPASDQR